MLERKLTEFLTPGEIETIFSSTIVSGVWVFTILDPLTFSVNSDSLIWSMFPHFISYYTEKQTIPIVTQKRKKTVYGRLSIYKNYYFVGNTM
ncbi:hypothetical protein LEP1GSC005_3547 [Leptospira santarosai str. ST188]|uniref:Uncharacterized protein n=4 Tax=Leptospira santarosai TaxID=28183 RepID=M6US84_9LEPT|nr:hypothetical protein LEP1GSC179_3569 [Leptospira santarosai str. MOR084]EKO79417.1 hypothetical protein LEP1GSC068_2334 [Leptospira sp. Fiocruz LV3954]EKS08243.1 hypothetical protein LEP1GSC071_2125 [Leptospira santarosai str. JET]EMF90824.1 hypothetical protein LEP1GSC005_3547 [Leptospira santarosai str. ST188]EMJ49455.1 hypothetical protein LEP1GSC169_1199 [Leptospira santarosai str. HAI1349]EMM85930.1 hypothetical protein LEP1GSC039_1786 [Leptospira santarosai str. 2000027870]EMO16018.1